MVVRTLPFSFCAGSKLFWENTSYLGRLSEGYLLESLCQQNDPKGVHGMTNTITLQEVDQVEETPSFTIFTLNPEGEVEKTGDVEKTKAAAKRKLKIMQEVIDSFGYSGIRFAVNDNTGEIVSGFYLPESEDED